MADHTVTRSQIGVHGVGLAANTEVTVFFEGWLSRVEVASLSSTQPVYFSLDGTAAEVEGRSCYLLFPEMNTAQVDVPGGGAGEGGGLVRLISAAPATVSVTRA